MKVEVFHSAFGDGFRFVASFENNEGFSVERVLEQVYMLTNTINVNWIENPGLEVAEEVLAKGGARSTSVDDFMKVAFEDGSEKWYKVAGFGFDEVSDETEIEYMGYTRNEAGQAVDRFFDTLSFSELRVKYAA